MRVLRCLCFIVMLLHSAVSFADTAECNIAIPASVQSQRILFPLSDVRLHEGQFKDIQELNHEYLLSLDPDRLLSWFRREAGITSKAPPYPFWESEDVWGGGPLAGHILGFYLSSMAMMYDATGDERICRKLLYTVDQLAECQRAGGNGYIAASINGYKLLGTGVTDGFRVDKAMVNGIWEPIYLLNKLMLGLYNVYMSCDIPLAKEVLAGVADWFGHEVLDKLTHRQIQELLISEHGSINESYVDVYSVTGDEKYLEWARLLNDEDMWVPASRHEDVLNGWHANTQIPKFTGFERVYTYTGEKGYSQAASFFWQTVVDKHTWVIGGNSTGEHFFQTEEFEKRVTDIGGPESCNSVNMMRLTEALYCGDGKMSRIDYYEKVLYNHILANYDPREGMCTYFTSMRPGHYKIYGTKYDSFWCCTGTGMEAPSKFAKMIYARHNDDLFVNLFIPSEVNWRQKNVVLTQKTDFPDRNSAEFIIKKADNTRFTLNIRCPHWNSSKTMTVWVNGEIRRLAADSEGYVKLRRNWESGDRVKIELTPEITAEYLKGSDKYAAFMYGPIVLAARIDNNDLKDEGCFRLARRTVASDMIPILKAYAIVGKPADVPGNMVRKDTERIAFECLPQVASTSFEMVPFNRIHFSRYEIYFPIYETREEYEEAYELQRDEIEENDFLENNTIDRVRLESSDSEKEHCVDGVNTSTGDSHGCTWRHAKDGGYFMYRMAVVPGIKQSICIKFIRTDNGDRIFDLLVDGRVIATFDHSRPRDIPRLFYYETVPVPDELLAGKRYITVKLHAKTGNMAGGIFDLRIIKSATFENPVFEMEDPWILRHKNDTGKTVYYTCKSGDRGIHLSCSDKLSVVNATSRVWKAPADNTSRPWNVDNIWAPELHFIDGAWYIYYAAGRPISESNGSYENQRAGVLRNGNADPMQGQWEDLGMLYTGEDYTPGIEPALGNTIYAIDMSVFELNGQLYAVWSGNASRTDGQQRLYIATMDDPQTISSSRVEISRPELSWEKISGMVNEGPALLRDDKNGKLFLVYSCNGSWTKEYRLGMLTLDISKDPMDKTNWTKSPAEVFYRFDDTPPGGVGVNGMGHCSFTLSPDGTEEWIVYHVNHDRNSGWDRRQTFIQKFVRRADGTPDFGSPVAWGEALPLPSGEIPTI